MASSLPLIRDEVTALPVYNAGLHPEKLRRQLGLERIREGRQVRRAGTGQGGLLIAGTIAARLIAFGGAGLIAWIGWTRSRRVMPDMSNISI